MMSDHPFLRQARRDLDKAEANRAKAEELLRGADLEIARLTYFIEQYEIYVEEEERQQFQGRARYGYRSITDAAISVLEKAAEPMSIQEILNALSALEIDIGGTNKAANLAAYLSKDVRIRFERGYGWMLSANGLFANESKNESLHEEASRLNSGLKKREPRGTLPRSLIAQLAESRAPKSKFDSDE